MSRVSQTHPQLVPVPIPDAVATLIGLSLPRPVLQAEIDAFGEVREIRRLRPLNSAEDRQDFEAALGRLARANKTLGAYGPRLIVRGAA
ncbi:hypothetical protein OG259_07895 [Streptomyces sp. NBC_00250]|uniref:hypothetical protein n=1 Tax=Streptomyces sp. NBC_00250 TaxID=2903641 RepID=UPI002E2CAEC7|nr:hypothetical protein [Streptomyces sp. NBC_00250]